jgi:hypothetical protein
MATLDDIRQRLIDQGITGTIALGSMPSTPDAVIALRQYGGMSPVHTLGRDNIFRRPYIQVAARAGANDYQTAQTKAELCFAALTFTEVTINGNRYCRVEPLQDPFVINEDDNSRWEIGFNIHIERAT